MLGLLNFSVCLTRADGHNVKSKAGSVWFLSNHISYWIPNRLHSSWYKRYRSLFPDVPHHRLPRERLSVRLPEVHHPGHAGLTETGLLYSVWSMPSSHRDLRHARETSHRSPGSEEQEHSCQEKRHLLHRRPRTGRQIQQVFYFLTFSSVCLRFWVRGQW